MTKPKKVLPITVPRGLPLSLGDHFTMEVPCDPSTGLLSGMKDAVLKRREFVVAGIVS